ncbi:MAG: hypothetical protein IJ370_09065 [Oscillospiraceae bacterium]|nr:hypothetical protein [Oscillospiraceae bacterium]
MKKIIAVIAVLALLLTPYVEVYKDGGTRTFTSLTYKIIIWKELPAVDGNHKTGTEIYFFPNNFFDLSHYR